MANCVKHKWRFSGKAEFRKETYAWFRCTCCGYEALKRFKQDSGKRNMRRSERMLKALNQ